MKTYVCDSCNNIIADPYEAQMKEFYYGSEYEFGAWFPVARKERKKLHLCKNCFCNLQYIAKQKEGAE